MCCARGALIAPCVTCCCVLCVYMCCVCVLPFALFSCRFLRVLRGWQGVKWPRGKTCYHKYTRPASGEEQSSEKVGGERSRWWGRRKRDRSQETPQTEAEKILDRWNRSPEQVEKEDREQLRTDQAKLQSFSVASEREAIHNRVRNRSGRGR